MPDQSGDKSQEATPHRRQRAREQGQVAKSQDLGSALLLVVGLVVLLLLGAGLTAFLKRYTAAQLGGEAWLSADKPFALTVWHTAVSALATYLLPILALILLAAILGNLFQVGFLFVPERIAPDLKRLDPLQGMRRIFSLANLMRLIFGLCKMGLIGAIAFLVLYNERDRLLGLSGLEVPQVAAYLVETPLWTALKIGVALLVLAILDYGFQRWKHEQDLRMTPQEVREEMKNLQGDPQIIARRRAVQRQLALNRLSTAVPKADVVITNPTELAVAIQYEPETMAAPIVVAKGAGLLAQRIRRLALEHDIPIVEKKPLAQALYRDVEVNHPIPSDNYAAVAEVLAYVYQLKGKTIPHGPGQAA